MIHLLNASAGVSLVKIESCVCRNGLALCSGPAACWRRSPPVGRFHTLMRRLQQTACWSCQETLSSWKSLRLLQFALPGDIVGGTTIRAPGSFKAHGMGGRDRHNFSQTMAVTSVRGSIIEAIENENTVYGLANLIGYLHGPRRCNET